MDEIAVAVLRLAGSDMTANSPVNQLQFFMGVLFYGQPLEHSKPAPASQII